MSSICASSDYEQLAAICDRVIVFARGRVFRELAGAELTKERIVEQCYAAMAGEARRGRRVTEATEAPEAAAAGSRRRERRRSGSPDARRALRAAARLGGHVRRLRDPAAGHVPDDVELHDDLRLAGDPRRADARAARRRSPPATTTSRSRRR